jgi:hypothetical protein
MIAQTFRGPHSLYRRYQGLLESTLTAIGFATLVTLALNNLAAYPYNWVIVIGIAIAVLGIRWPLAAYIVAIVVMLYPIYMINLYLAVLFLALGALGHRFCAHYLGATTLVLAAPLLAKYHVHWLVPILGGLWWGGTAGAWVGGLSALWGKVMNGMTGQSIDWLIAAGHTPDLQGLAARFQNVNSLETLLLIVEPFADTSTVVLYNLLQIIGWTVAGGFVGALAWRKWVKYRAPWSVMVVTAAGGLIMLATHVGLPYWLPEAVSAAAGAASPDPAAPLFSLIVVIIVGTTVYSLREVLDLPVIPRRAMSPKQPHLESGKPAKSQPFKLFGRFQKASSEERREGSERQDDLIPQHRPVRVPHQSELPEWEPPKNDSGLIMLEID